MADLDAMAPNFSRAKNLWPSASNLSSHYDALAACYDGDQQGIIEHVKSFIECVCITILKEQGETVPPNDPNTTELLGAALAALQIKNSRGASKLDKVLSGFNKLSDALSEMRNHDAPIAHGKDGFLDRLSTDHHRVFLTVGDSLLGVLIAALEGSEPDLFVTREEYERFKHLHERIDRTVGIEAEVEWTGESPLLIVNFTTDGKEEAFKLRIEPSRLLYGVDRGAYLQVLASTTSPEKQEVLSEPSSTFTATSISHLEPQIKFVARYSGRLDNLEPGLQVVLQKHRIAAASKDSAGNELLPSLLATADGNMGQDWKQRDTLHAALKVALRRTFVHFNVRSPQMPRLVERLMAWFKNHGPDTITNEVFTVDQPAQSRDVSDALAPKTQSKEKITKAKPKNRPNPKSKDKA